MASHWQSAAGGPQCRIAAHGLFFDLYLGALLAAG
jgi:hypothetical protein